MDDKNDSDGFYDSRLEPDVILVDSDESNLSLPTCNTGPTTSELMFKALNMQLANHAIQKLRASTSPRDSGPLQQCPTCKKYFKRLSSHLLTHQDIKEDPERPFTCSFCHKLFKNLSNLTVHMRSHTGFKPYVCDVCNKGFTQSGNLVHHQRIHTGTKPYKCPVCERAFTQPGNLGNHIRLHSQEKPFQCHLCERAFTQSSNLNSHLKNNHKEFKSET